MVEWDMLRTLIDATVDRAVARMRVPSFRPATVLDASLSATPTVLVDGDTSGTVVQSLEADLSVGMRVMVVFYPPSGALVVGRIQAGPLSVPNLTHWWDFSHTGQMEFEGGGVSTVYDQSGNGRTAQQSTLASMPAYLPDGIKVGLGCLSFAGAQSLFTQIGSNGGGNDKPVTLFAVVQITNTAADRAILGTSTSGTINWQVNASEGLRLNKHFIAVLGNSSSSIPVGVPSVVATSYSAVGLVSFYIDGAAAGTATNNLPFDGTDPRLGIGEGAAQPFVGQIGEILKYNRVLTDEERNVVTGYLATKWT